MRTRRKENMTSYLGTITLSDTVIVSDPCYTRGTWCQGVLQNVVPGKYSAYVYYSDEDSWGIRVARLCVSCQEQIFPGSRSEVAPFEVGVDSGQAGIFDNSIYPEGEPGEFEDKTSFYGKVCDITLSELQAGLVDKKGVVSSSGYGDGSYDCIIKRDEDGRIYDIEIVFLDKSNRE